MEVPSFQGGISTLLKLLKLVVKIRLHLEHMVQEYCNHEGPREDENTVIPDLPTPQKPKGIRARQET